MLSFFMVYHTWCYHLFYVIILCYHFSQFANVILFVFSFFLVQDGCYHLQYVIIFRVLSFLLSFDVIIFHSQQMLSFLCYHFPLYIFCVIICVIIWCYHFLLSFPPFFLFPENVTHSILPQRLQRCPDSGIPTRRKGA